MRSPVEINLSVMGVLAVALAALVVGNSQSAVAQNYASPERTAIAVGHYARARALLVEALAEFESGREIARPDVLLDPEEWRLSVVSRTEELNRLLDPQPRVTRNGVQFKASKALIRRERDRLPTSGYGAQDSNTYGEEQRQAELSSVSKKPVTESSATGLDSEADVGNTSVSTSPQPRALLDNSSSGTGVTAGNTPAALSTLEKPAHPAIQQLPTESPGGLDIQATKESLPSSTVDSATTGSSDEDAEISQAIEQAIKARLEKMSAEGKNASGDEGKARDALGDGDEHPTAAREGTGTDR